MVIRICLTSIIGMVALSAGLEGYFLTHLKIWEKLPLIAAGILMVIPSGITDVIGIAIFAVIIVFEIIRKKASKKNEITA